ncbi:MAG: hypothetical protein ACTSQY_10775, partial [Candidatus Odinarchaeia archaeon]
VSYKYIIVTSTQVPIETKKILSDNNLLDKINLNGKKSLEKLLENPTVQTFLDVSRLFANGTGLIPESIIVALDELNKLKDVVASMCMLGQSVFTIVRDDKKHEVISVLESFFSDDMIFTSKINKSGLQVKY